jgi:EpsD family peptidyl-prolyl cis-trans isomerase
MMGSKLSPIVMLAIFAAVGLASCGNGKPSGQVVAKVGKEEITTLDLQAEMAGYQAPTPAARKAAEQQALQQIIQRKILADAAKKQKIGQTPEFARLRARTDELLLVKTWQDTLARAVPPPNLDEAQDYIAKHPDSFSARKRIDYDAVKYVSAPDPALQAALRPLHTLDEVKAVLNGRNIHFETESGEVDALTADPRLVDFLMKIQGPDLFQTVSGNLYTLGKVREVKTDPVSGQVAVSRAMDQLRTQRAQEAVGRRFSGVLAQAKNQVQYSKAYEPSAAPAKPAAGPQPAAKAP